MLDDEANGINAFSVLLYTFSRGRVNMGHQNASPFQNHSARVAFSVRKFEHVSPLLEELQWASVDRRVWAGHRDGPPTVKGRVSTDIGNMELWARGWRIYFSELTVSFKPQGKFFNLLYFEHPWAKSAMTYYRLHPQHISQHYKQKRKPQQRYYR